MLVHDANYLSTRCPRITTLLRQFDDRMYIHQTAKSLLHITAPFSIADKQHYIRRFHFDDPRGIFAQHDPENARVLEMRFQEMWQNSRCAFSTTTLGL